MGRPICQPKVYIWSQCSHFACYSILNVGVELCTGVLSLTSPKLPKGCTLGKTLNPNMCLMETQNLSSRALDVQGGVGEQMSGCGHTPLYIEIRSLYT